MKKLLSIIIVLSVLSFTVVLHAADMRFMVWTHDDGITDMDFRDGDIFHAGLATEWTPSELETSRYLCIEIQGVQAGISELLSSEFAPGPGNDNVIRRIRKYRVNYINKFSEEELAVIRDPEQVFPMVTDRFNQSDIIRK